MQKRSAPREVLLRLEGTFDVRAARRVDATIDRAGPGERVVVDVSLVREFHDFGIAVLGQTVKHAAPGRVALRGLRQHQARLLRYFGVDAGRFGPAPEEERS